jgi:hypothetical protein
MHRTLKAAYLGLAVLGHRDGLDDCRSVVVIEKSKETCTHLLPIPPYMKRTNKELIFRILKPLSIILDPDIL